MVDRSKRCCRYYPDPRCDGRGGYHLGVRNIYLAGNEPTGTRVQKYVIYAERIITGCAPGLCLSIDQFLESIGLDMTGISVDEEESNT